MRNFCNCISIDCFTTRSTFSVLCTFNLTCRRCINYPSAFIMSVCNYNLSVGVTTATGICHFTIISARCFFAYLSLVVMYVIIYAMKCRFKQRRVISFNSYVFPLSLCAAIIYISKIIKFYKCKFINSCYTNRYAQYSNSRALIKSCRRYNGNNVWDSKFTLKVAVIKSIFTHRGYRRRYISSNAFKINTSTEQRICNRCKLIR